MGLSLTSIWNNKCPKCRNGELFEKPFEFNNPLAMHKFCNNCNQNFEPEPGFYYGAMFISYGISTFLLLPLALTLVFYLGWSVEGAMVFVIFLGAILFFKILRVSRSLWIHIMVKYDANHNNN